MVDAREQAAWIDDEPGRPELRVLPGGAAPSVAPAPRRAARDGATHTTWYWVRTVASVGLLAAAVALIAAQGATLRRSITRLAGLDTGWLVVAVAAEGGSMVAFGRLQQRLLAAGGSTIRLPTMVAITTASNALTGTLPGGFAWAAAWFYDQLGARGVSRFLRVWVFFVAGGVSSFALFVVIAAGVEIAGTRGPFSSLRWLVLLLAVVPVVVVAVEVLRDRRPVSFLVGWVGGRVEQRVPGGPRLLEGARQLVARFTAVRLGPGGWAEVLSLALANWLLDGVVVVASLEALGVHVPWDGILVVYGLTQISASIPITPGGIGVVEGSMVALLLAYGVPWDGALAPALLYRIVSFWSLVPVGWGVWSVLEASTRRRRATAGRR